MFFPAAIALTNIFSSPVWAQPNMAQCAPGFDWNKNTLGQDPCTIGSILGASCRGLMEYTYPPLTDGTQYYLPPRGNRSGDVMCDCNTVMYSLYMTCASCQGGIIYSWTQWTPECSRVYVSQYPANIPQGTAVPRWAYYNITSLPNQTWNESVVMSIGWDAEVLLKRIDAASSPPDPSPPTSDPPGPPTSHPLDPPTSPPSDPPTSSPHQTNSPAEPHDTISVISSSAESHGMTTITKSPMIDPTPTETPTVITPYPSPTTSTRTLDGPTNPVIPTNPTNPPVPSVPTTSPGPITSTSTGVTDLPMPTTNSPGPTIPTGTVDLPGSTIPTSVTSLPESAIPTSTTSRPESTIPPGTTTSTTNLSDLPGSTVSPNSTNLSQRTTLTQGVNVPSATNASNKKGGTNPWAIVIFIFWGALM